MANLQIQPGSQEDLRRWFQQQLEASPVQYEETPLNYEGNTPYDILYYRLQEKAARYWQETYGFVPTPGQLYKAFFGAQFDRFHTNQKSYRHWRRKIQCWFAFLTISLWGS
ncbi:MAG: hypothetical protein AXA67_10050 [Methylothermaceae bacteria B42]|nr:MAG: hypothetical protein AXA67_10050 [Methylothermaceae bacteria B42]HHJ39645.1 hypothetical protein [Methylothermaceae bacterium]